VRSILAYEKKLDRLREVSDRQWPGPRDPVEEAVEEVFASTGEDIYTSEGIFRAAPDALERVTHRAKLEMKLHPVAFKHEDSVLAPFADALQLAVAFAAAEPRTVIDHLDLKQRRWEMEMKEPGRAYLGSLVNQWRAGWALARQWVGRGGRCRDARTRRLLTATTGGGELAHG
jgi:hypothetical protein